MRRVAIVMLLMGCTLVVGSPAAGRAVAPAGHGLAGAHVTGWAAWGAPLKVIRFAGYTLEVPADWPVYRLDRDPGRCVRFDRHAVYLGAPGADQQCPAHLAGRVETVSIEAAGSAPGFPPRLPGRASVAWDAANHEMRAVLPHRGVIVTATYGAAPGLVRGILATLHWSGTGQTVTSVPARPAAGHGRHHHHHCRVRCCHHRRCHPRWLRMPVRGLDTCTAPSLRAMRAWYHAYKAAAIYLGGPEAACGWGNLSAAWIRAAVRIGWALIPAYVGPQAPCSGFAVRIRPGHAEQQGRASAAAAIRLARDLGMHRGAVLYDDMEAYRPHHGRCRRPVLAFLDGWTRELHARGYLSGVYSSAGAAARDLGRFRSVYGHPVARPNALWFALWDGRRNLHGLPYVRNTWWNGHRIKQYRGARHRRIGGVRLSFDADLVDGAVYR